MERFLLVFLFTGCRLGTLEVDPLWKRERKLDEEVCEKMELGFGEFGVCAVSHVTQVWDFFTRSSPGHTQPCPLSPSVGSHCCDGSHFWAQRIGAACLAFLRLKVSTSSSTKTLIVPSRPQILDGVKEKRFGSRKPYLFSKRGEKLNHAGISPDMWGSLEWRLLIQRVNWRTVESCKRLMDFLSTKVMGGLSVGCCTWHYPCLERCVSSLSPANFESLWNVSLASCLFMSCIGVDKYDAHVTTKGVEVQFMQCDTVWAEMTERLKY